MELILASNSPRRRELLASAGVPFTVVPSRFEERAEGLTARETAAYFAREKAREVAGRYPEAAVLGADTVVALDGRILPKPGDAARAKEMLKALSGRVHSVFTGVCLLSRDIFLHDVCETEVTFHCLTEELIERYAVSGLPLDKAGAYGIQDEGYDLVEGYKGSYTNVVGLPMELVRTFLKEGHIW